MNRCFSLACALGLCVVAVGCAEKAPARTDTTRDAEGGINIQWPGGSVQVDPKTGDTRVNAQGVDVEAGPKTGARVRTPRVDVKASRQGVNVQAPGAQVDVNR